MATGKYARRLQFECSAIPGLRTLFLSVVIIALLCLAVLPLPLSIKAVAALLIAALAWRCWRRRCELGAAPVNLLWDADGDWWWRQGGEETGLFLRGDTYLASGLAILNFSTPALRQGRSLVVTPASIGAGNFRRLSVRLRLEGAAAVRGKNGLRGEDNIEEREMS